MNRPAIFVRSSVRWIGAALVCAPTFAGPLSVGSRGVGSQGVGSRGVGSRGVESRDADAAESASSGTDPAGTPREDEVVPDEVEARIRAAVGAKLAPLIEAGAPGASCALSLPACDAFPDGAEIAVALGLADPAGERPMQPETRLLSGSVGKTYLIGVLLHLLADETLELDAPALSFFEGEERAFVASLPGGGTYTLRQLLRHESGLPRYVFDAGFNRAMVAEPDRVWTPRELLTFVVGNEPLHTAGEGWAYSDTNYILAGWIVETVTGKRFYDLARTLLLEPLELRDTIPTDTRRIERMAQGHVIAARGMGVPEWTLDDGAFVFNVQFEWCGGGWANTPTDLARWVRALYGGQLTGDEWLDELLDTVPAPGLGPGVRYGLGVMVRETELGPLRYHDGFMPGYLTSTGFSADVGVAAAFQMNVDDARVLRRPPVKLLEELIAIAAEAAEL